MTLGGKAPAVFEAVMTCPKKPGQREERNSHIRKESRIMRKSKFTEEQIVYALKQAELGVPVLDVCRKYGVSEQAFYRWRKKYGGL
jgi:putative transposase